MQIYNYHPETKEFLSATEARLDPLETQKQGIEIFLIPAHATPIIPPTAGDHEKAVFEEGEWQLVADFRGPYYLPNGTTGAIFDLGENLPEGATIEPSPEYLAAVEAREAEAAQLAAQEAAFVAQKAAEVETAFPSWAEIESTLMGITSLEEVKVVLVKIARVIYLEVKHKTD